MNTLTEKAKIIARIPIIFVWDFLKSVWFSIGDFFLQIGYGINNFFASLSLKLASLSLFFQGIDTYFNEYGKSVENWFNNTIMKWISEIITPIATVSLGMVFDMLKAVVYKLLSLPGDMIKTNIKRAFGGTAGYNTANNLTFNAIGGAVNSLVKLINLPLNAIKSELDKF